MAESFGADAARYDRARPPYPDALVARVVAGLPGRTVLDVGCGTGIEARQFAAAGCSVLGVEPDPRMAGFARASGVDVEEATFEAWDPAARTFDAVVAGQSWHWIDPVAGAAKAADVLVPGGRLALFSHVFDPPAEVADAYRTALDAIVPDRPRTHITARSALEGYQRLYSRFADAIEAGGRFGAVEHWRYDWQRDYTRDDWLDLLPTTGELTRLAAADLGEVLRAVGDAVDARGGTFTMDYVTIAVSATR